MIAYGLKLWSNNEDLFAEAVALAKDKKVDFIELYHNPRKPVDEQALASLKGILVMIHNTDDYGFEKFVVNEKEMTIWKKSLQLADFLHSKYIIVHPGRGHTFESFSDNLKKIDDPRILIENMAGLGTDDKKMYGQTLSQLKKIKTLKPICFDLEKAVKAAVYQQANYKEFIKRCIEILHPFYFHI